MKKGYHLTPLLLIIVVAFLLTGGSDFRVDTSSLSTVPTTTTTVDEEALALKEAYKKNPDRYVHFSRSTEPRDCYVLVTDIMEYDTQYPDCNGTWFRDQLTGEDLCIYNAYLYAMENCFIYFDLYVQDSDKDFYYIREALCMDSPFLEQNKNTHGENIYKKPNNYIGESVGFRIEQFTSSRWEKKMEALQKCRQIIADIPAECSTLPEKMEYVYKYVCDNVEYVDYDNMDDQDYLYDAVCKGETVCDGYSNMLNLLFNLVGAECCEAMGRDIKDLSQATPEELENATGHTWVVAKIDDRFYNFDATFEDTNTDESLGDGWLYFGFSDERVSVKYLELEDLRPKCTDTSRDFPFADLVVQNIQGYKNIQKIAKLTDNRTNNGQYKTIIAVKTIVPDNELETFLDRYVLYVKKISYVNTTTIYFENSMVIIMNTKPW